MKNLSSPSKTSKFTTFVTQAKLIEDAQALSKLMGDSLWPEALTFVQTNPHVATQRFRGVLSNMAGNPFLNFAVKSNRLDLVRALVEAGAPLEGRTRDGETPLFIAFGYCELQGMQMALDNNRRFDVADYLIEAGCRLDTYNNNGNSPIDASNGDIPVRFVKAMIDAGINLNTFHQPSSMPMVSHMTYTSQVSKLKGRREVLETIIRARPNLNPHSRKFRDIPLVQAMTYGAVDVAELMLANGADPEHCACDGKSILFAVDKAATAQWVLKKFPLLLDKPDHAGRTPLMEYIDLAIGAKGNKDASLAEETVKVLITAGANLDAVDHQGPVLCKTPRERILKKPSHPLCFFLKTWLASQEARKALGELQASRQCNALPA